MTRGRSKFRQMLLLATALVLGEAGLTQRVSAMPAGELTACNLGSLPSDIQSHLKEDFGLWKVQEAGTLSEDARKTWAGRKPLACAGIAVGLFQNAKAPSYAVLLVPVDHPDAGYRFLVFCRKTEQSSYEATIVEQSDDHGSSNYFIRKAPVGRFFDEASKRKFQVQAPDVILMVDSAAHEYGAEICFWSNGHFQLQPVDE